MNAHKKRKRDNNSNQKSITSLDQDNAQALDLYVSTIIDSDYTIKINNSRGLEGHSPSHIHINKAILTLHSKYFQALFLDKSTTQLTYTIVPTIDLDYINAYNSEYLMLLFRMLYEPENTFSILPIFNYKECEINKRYKRSIINTDYMKKQWKHVIYWMDYFQCDRLKQIISDHLHTILYQLHLLYYTPRYSVIHLTDNIFQDKFNKARYKVIQCLFHSNSGNIDYLFNDPVVEDGRFRSTAESIGRETICIMAISYLYYYVTRKNVFFLHENIVSSQQTNFPNNPSSIKSISDMVDGYLDAINISMNPVKLTS